MTEGAKGSQWPKNDERDISIPNQDKSTALKMNRAKSNEEQEK